jgi:RNA polymerase sigma factor (sigma-70 family)
LGDRTAANEPLRPVSAGAHSFLDTLARRYRAALTRFFERRAPALRGEAEDLTQEVFERLAKRETGEEIGNVESYLFRTASNVLIDRTRRRKTHRADDHVQYEDELHAVEDFAPDRVLIGREEVERVIRAIEDLPERTRIAFALHRFEELKYAEIAFRLGVSISAVEKHIIKALRHISDVTGTES